MLSGQTAVLRPFSDKTHSHVLSGIKEGKLGTSAGLFLKLISLISLPVKTSGCQATFSGDVGKPETTT
jgi:hypothetical protein